jgi:hypothetical protein
MFSLQQSWKKNKKVEQVLLRSRAGQVAQIMYTHVSKCKNDKIKIFKKLKKLNTKEQIIQLINEQMNGTDSSQKYKWSKTTSLAIKEMQIKTMLRFHLIPVRLAIMKKTENKPQMLVRIQGKETLIHCWWGM